MSYYAFLPFAGCVANILLGLYIINRGYREKGNQVFFLFNMAIAYWSFLDVLRRIAPDEGTALFWMRTGTLGSCYSSAFLLHFFIIYTRTHIGQIKAPFFWILYTIPFVFFILEHMTDRITNGVTAVYWGYKPIEGDWYHIHLIFIVGCAAAALVLNIRYLIKAETGKDKSRSYLLMIAISIVLVGGIITEIIPQYFKLDIVPLTTTLTTLMAFVLGFAIIKHDLMTPISYGIQKKLDFLVSRSPAVISTCENTSKGLIHTYISNNVQSILGYHPRDLLDDPELWKNRVHPNDLPQVEQGNRNLMETGVSVSEYRFLNSQGTYRWLHDEKCLYTHPDTRREIISCWYDITESKKAEEQLSSAKDELERRVKERTRELLDANAALHLEIKERRKTEEKLKHKTIEAESANKAKSDFLANMSHELRTPLNGVLGMNTLLMSTSLDTEQKTYVDTIETSSRELLKLITDILDFSRIEAGSLRLDNKNFDLYRFMKDFHRFFSFQAEQKDLKLNLHIQDRVPQWIICDPGRLNQILANIVDNSIKFTNQGWIDISVDLQHRSLNDVSLLFTVKDTGPGLPGKNTERLFDSFTQGDSSTTKKFGGTGLGLSIARQLCRLMNGDIQATNHPEKGAVFYFTIACKASKHEAVKKPLADQNVLNRKRCGRILLVEDNAINRKVATGILKKSGFQVDIAENGEEALTHLKKTKFDAVLMDCRMPVMDGYEATRKIRLKETGVLQPEIPVIALTANAMEGDEKKCRDAGMNDYLSKPVKSAKLLKVLDQWILSSSKNA